MSVSIHETALDNDPQNRPRIYWRGSGTVMQLPGNTDFEWLWKSIQEVQIDEVNTTTPILCNLIINNTPVKGLFDTGASMSVCLKIP